MTLLPDVCRLQIKGKQAFVSIDFTYGSIDLLFAIMCDFPGRQLRNDIDPFYDLVETQQGRHGKG